MKLFCKKHRENYIKGKAHDRKGLGMELALLVLLVTFACSTLLVSSALLGKETLVTKESAVLERIALDEFAERVLAADPEVAVTAIGAWYLSRAVNLQSTTLTRAPQAVAESRPAFVAGLLSGAAVLGAIVWDVVEIFRPLQDPETGDFVIENLALVNWPLVGIVTAVGAVLWLVFTCIRKGLSK